MSMTRREMLLAGLGLLAGGCGGCASRSARGFSSAAAGAEAGMPGAAWPTSITRPSPGGGVVRVAPPAKTAPSAAPRQTADHAVEAITRSTWAKAGPILDRINPMNGVTRMTVHHEGDQPVWFTDAASAAARIEKDREYHVNIRGWGDIGYHYIIDRAGRLWQGRDVRYQGAHVKYHNKHNIGVMCLGNFDQQSPSSAQLAALRATLTTLRHHYRIPIDRVYTHQELRPTHCPGRRLQPRVAFLRSHGYLA